MPKRKPTRSWADLTVPIRPADVPYKGGEDYDARALLLANGYELDAAELIDLLDVDFELGVLQAAAARALGEAGERAAIDALETLVADPIVDESARVQAAYALARMGVDAGKGMLMAFVADNPEASPAPLQAAGALAALGDPRGFEVVSRALDSPNNVTAMIACKQLFHFTALEAGLVDVYAAYARALSRPEPTIVGEARAQLVELDTEAARTLLKG